MKSKSSLRFSAHLKGICIINLPNADVTASSGILPRYVVRQVQIAAQSKSYTDRSAFCISLRVPEFQTLSEQYKVILLKLCEGFYRLCASLGVPAILPHEVSTMSLSRRANQSAERISQRHSGHHALLYARIRSRILKNDYTTCHNVKELTVAMRAGIPRIIISPIYTTKTHPNAKALGKIGLFKMLKHAAENANTAEIFIMGGINKQTFAQIKMLDHANAIRGFGAIGAFVQGMHSRRPF